MSGNSRCLHGVDPKAKVYWDTMTSIAEQYSTLRKATTSDARKKANRNLYKSHARYIDRNGESRVIKSLYATATALVLEGDYDGAGAAHFHCQYVTTILCRGIIKDTDKQPIPYVGDAFKVLSQSGLVCEIAKRIPCSCLDHLVRQMGGENKTELCEQCKREVLKPDAFQCGKCKTMVYCSKECQEKHWFSYPHKDWCRSIKTIDNATRRRNRAIRANRSEGEA